MLSRKSIILFLISGILSLFVLGGYLIYSFRYGRVGELFEKPNISKQQAIELAKNFLKSLDFDVKNYPEKYIGYHSRNEETLYLLKKYNYKSVKQLIKEGKISYAYWSIMWSGIRSERLNVCIDSYLGKVINYDFIYYPSREEKITNLEESKAKDLAEKFLISQGIDLASLELTNVNKGTLGLQKEFYFRWLNKNLQLDGASYVINLAVKQDKVADYSHGLQLPKDFNYEYENSQFISRFWAILSSGISVLLGIILVILVIIKRKILNWQLGKLWAGILGLVFFINSLNAQTNFVFYIDVVYKILITAFFSLVMLILIPITISLFKESFNKDIFINKNRDNILSSIIVCYSLTFLNLVAFLGVFFILKHFKIYWDVGTNGIVNEIFTSKVIYLAPFLIGIIPAFTEEFFRGFTMAFCKKIFKSTFVAILIASFLWGFAHTSIDASAYPGYIGGIEKFISGIIIGYVLLFFGVEIAVLWHFLNNFLATNIFFFYLGPVLSVYAIILSILILLPFLIAIYLYFKKQGAILNIS